MTDIESPEAFAETLIAGADDACDAEVEVMLGDDGRAWLVEAIRARDAAVRREALREAADMLQRNAVEAYGYSNAGRDRALCSGLARALRALVAKERSDG